MKTLLVLVFFLLPNSLYSQFSPKNIINIDEGGNTNIYCKDIDEDGDIDILASDTDKIVWYPNDGNGGFPEQKIITTLSSSVRGIYASDLDGDGDLDILIPQGPNIFWYENDGSENFLNRIVITAQVIGATSAHAADLDNDGDMDVISASIIDNKIAWYENDGNGKFSEQKIISVQVNAPLSVHTGDLDNDGNIDVLSSSTEDDKIAWYKNDGSGKFSEQKIISTQDSNPNGAFAVDIDMDGDLDVLSYGHKAITWFENTGNGSFFTTHVISTQVRSAFSAFAGDLDGDEDIDIVSHSWLNNKIVWFENIGNKNFSTQKNISLQEKRPFRVYAADLTGDGGIDVLASTKTNGDELIWYENLQNYSSIYGTVFFDENGNDLKDDEEKGIRKNTIKIAPDAISSYTDEKGNFQFFVPSGTYTVNNVLDSCWSLTTDSSSYTLTVDEKDNIGGIDFGFQPTSGNTSIQTRINSAPTRCGFEVPFWLMVENDGCQPIKGYYGLVLSPLVNLIETSHEPDKIKGDTLLWKYDNLIAAETEEINLLFEIAGVNSIGENIQITGLSYIEDEMGNLSLTDTYDYKSEIRCAYDPNDKLVTPNRLTDYDQNYTLFGESLEYTIRFQNTGNDTAFNVVIRDTLDKNLDWETFKPILTSHPFETFLHKDGQVEFSFKNIQLPDSTTNEPLSHGFVIYKILPKKDLPENTVIENTAGIYFDFNPAIITNTTMNVMVLELPKTTSIHTFQIAQLVKVYPNPFYDFVTVEQKIFEASNLPTLSLFDVVGRQIQSTLLKDATQEISTAHLGKGLYFYRVTDAKGQMIGNGKLVKH